VLVLVLVLVDNRTTDAKMQNCPGHQTEWIPIA
jgi:hypothetical protein